MFTIVERRQQAEYGLAHSQQMIFTHIQVQFDQKLKEDIELSIKPIFPFFYFLVGRRLLDKILSDYDPDACKAH